MAPASTKNTSNKSKSLEFNEEVYMMKIYPPCQAVSQPIKLDEVKAVESSRPRRRTKPEGKKYNGKVQNDGIDMDLYKNVTIDFRMLKSLNGPLDKLGMSKKLIAGIIHNGVDIRMATAYMKKLAKKSGSSKTMSDEELTDLATTHRRMVLMRYAEEHPIIVVPEEEEKKLEKDYSKSRWRQPRKFVPTKFDLFDKSVEGKEDYQSKKKKVKAFKEGYIYIPQLNEGQAEAFLADATVEKAVEIHKFLETKNKAKLVQYKAEKLKFERQENQLKKAKMMSRVKTNFREVGEGAYEAKKKTARGSKSQHPNRVARANRRAKKRENKVHHVAFRAMVKRTKEVKRVLKAAKKLDLEEKQDYFKTESESSDNFLNTLMQGATVGMSGFLFSLATLLYQWQDARTITGKTVAMSVFVRSIWNIDINQSGLPEKYVSEFYNAMVQYAPKISPEWKKAYNDLAQDCTNAKNTIYKEYDDFKKGVKEEQRIIDNEKLREQTKETILAGFQLADTDFKYMQALFPNRFGHYSNDEEEKRMFYEFPPNQIEENLQTESLSDCLGGMYAVFLSALQSPLAIAIRNIALAMTSLKIFNKDISFKLYEFFGKPAKMNLLALSQLIFENVMVLIRTGEAIIRGIPIRFALFEGDPTYKIISEATSLLKYEKLLYAGLPVPGHMDRFEFYSKAEQLAEAIKPIQAQIAYTNPRYNDVVRTQQNLTRVMTDVYTSLRGANRRVPCAVKVEGDPGIGKGPIMNLIFALFCKLKGRVFTPDYVFPRVVSSDYWEGYKPLSQPIIHYSELGNKKKELVERSGDDVTLELCSVIDSMPYVVNMAAAEDKGKVYCMPELVVLDTNNPGLNLDSLTSNPAAVRRRFISIVPEVLPEFRKLNSCEIDPVKSFSAGGDIMDRWKFTVYVERARTVRKSEKVILLKDANVYNMIGLMEELFTQHLQVQDGILRDVTSIEKLNETLERASYDREGLPDLPIVSRVRAVNESVVHQVFNEEKILFDQTSSEQNVENTGSTAEFNVKNETESRTVMTYFAIFMTKMCFFISAGLSFRVVGWLLGSLITDFYSAFIRSMAEAIFDFNSMKPDVMFMFRRDYRIYLFLFVAYYFTPWYIFPFLCIVCLVSFEYIAYVIFKTTLPVSSIRERIEDNMDRIKFALYGGKYNLLKAYKWTKVIGILIGSFAAYKVVKKIFDIFFPTAMAEMESSTFRVEHTVNDELNQLEETLHCGKSYKRIPNSINQQVWNVQEVLVKPPVGTCNVEELYKAISRNIRRVKIIAGETVVRTYVLGLFSNIALVNTHALKGRTDCFLQVSTSGVCKDVEVTKDTQLSAERMVEVGNDQTLIDLTGILFTDIRKHIVDGIMPSSLNVFISGCHSRAAVDPNSVKMNDKEMGDIVITNFIKYNWPHHSNGVCGLPLLGSLGKGSVIVGIHCAGSSQSAVSYASPLNRSVLDKAAEKLQSQYMMPLHSESISFSDWYGIPDLIEPAARSPFRYEDLGGIQYYGKIPVEVSVNDKSKIQKTPYCKEIFQIFDNAGMTQSAFFGRPHMKPFTKNGEYISPYNIGLKKMGSQRAALNPKILLRVREVLLTHLKNGLTKVGVTKLAPLDIETAINGAKDDVFIRRINASTASGVGFSGKKYKHVPLVNEEECIREPTEDLKLRIRDIIKKYLRGDAVHPINKVQLKDEPRLMEKVVKGKTRLFYITPLDYLIVARMFLAPLYTLMVQFGDLFCTSVGINMYTGADEFYKSLKAFSDLIMEGDYGSYDQLMPEDVSRLATTIITDLLRWLGYSEDALKIVVGILTDSLFPMLCLLADLFMVAGLQPSGKYATAEDNSLKGLILLMYFFYSFHQFFHLNFFDFVKPKTYGDDCIQAVKEAIAKFYNDVTYAEFCKRVYKLDYTTASKDQVQRPFTTLKEMHFLKRTFVESKEFNRVVAPLDYNSIIRSLSWFMPSDNVSRSDQLADSFKSALWELFFHVGPETFDKMRNSFGDLIHEYLGLERVEIENILPTRHKIAVKLCFVPPSEQDLVEVNYDSPLLDNYPMLITESYAHVDRRAIQLRTPGYVSVRTQSGREYTIRVPSNFNWCANLPDPYNLGDLKAACEAELLEIDQLLLEEKRDFLPDIRELRRKQLTGVKLTKSDLRVLKLLSRQRSLQITLTVTERHLLRRQERLFTESEVEVKSTPPSNVDTLQNVTSIHGDDEKTVNEDVNQVVPIGQATALPLDAFFRRPVFIHSGGIPLSTDIELALPIWNNYTLIPAVRAKLRNYAYFRGTMCVRVQFSGMPFHYGRLLVSYQPYPERNMTLQAHEAAFAIDPTWRPLYVNYLSQSREATTIDIKSNRSVVIRCPFISTKPMHRLFNADATAISDVTPFDDLENAGSLYIVTINQIKATTATPSTPFGYIYAWIEDVELGTSTGTQIEITTESDERKVGPVEKFATKSSQFVEHFVNIPYIGKFAQASRIVLSGVAGLSSLFGWSKPSIIAKPMFVKNNGFQNGAHGIGYDTNMRLTLDPEQELDVDPRFVGIEEDEMSIAHLASIETYLTTFTWAEDSPIMTSPIWLCEITPNLSTTVTIDTVKYAQPTACSYASRPFFFWRGDMRFRVEIVCSSFHRGKLLIYYEPNIAQNVIINTDLNMNKQFIMVVDIQETQDFEFCINWNHYRAWAEITGGSEETYHGTTIGVSNRYSKVNGYIGIVPMTELQSPDDSNVEVNVFVSCDRLQVNQFGTTLINPDRSVVVAESETLYYTESESTIAGDEVKCFELNESNSDDTQIARDHFGERPLSLRTCLKRYVSTYTNVASTGAANVVTYVKFANLHIIPDLHVYGTTTSSYPSLFDYMRPAFLGIRGGIKKRIHIITDGEFDVNCPVKVSLDSRVGTLPSETLTENTSGLPKAVPIGTVTYMPFSNAGIEFELPFYSNNMMAFSFASDLIGTTNTEEINTSWSKTYSVEFFIKGTYTKLYLLEESAAAEDFQMFRFSGAPFYKY